ncbi:hypothetical protein MESS2_990023 [Mesorhizobium metallidurans STM 2683]|uniref:Uncharacterized protein n=1 Tax=Mesorhizobium metallidurans STM 2683 TaxID=1297569 RepID=M5EZ99_9HYPH|nr:hypothetical protein MESS2_990023 [Mesorhizobium metallidurans STM 2683]
MDLTPASLTSVVYDWRRSRFTLEAKLLCHLIVVAQLLLHLGWLLLSGINEDRFPHTEVNPPWKNDDA